MKTCPQLRLENQICFPLYACSKEIVRRYAPLLEPYKLTYTHYIAMMVIWEAEEITVSDLGKKLFLDSGTLTPVLKKLEANGYVKRKRKSEDERCVIVSLSAEGRALQEKLADIPMRMGSCMNLSKEDAGTLYGLLYKVLNNFRR
ncbi:MAG: MarR family winged helix-turn-helix transcriptional regulator [Sphaerochaeta sp.]